MRFGTGAWNSHNFSSYHPGYNTFVKESLPFYLLLPQAVPTSGGHVHDFSMCGAASMPILLFPYSQAQAASSDLFVIFLGIISLVTIMLLSVWESPRVLVN